MISYKPFLKLLVDRELKKKDVMEMANISKATVARMNGNEYISLEVIDKICKALQCQPGDLIEYVPDRKEAR